MGLEWLYFNIEEGNRVKVFLSENAKPLGQYKDRNGNMADAYDYDSATVILKNLKAERKFALNIEAAKKYFPVRMYAELQSVAKMESGL